MRMMHIIAILMLLLIFHQLKIIDGSCNIGEVSCDEWIGLSKKRVTQYGTCVTGVFKRRFFHGFLTCGGESFQFSPNYHCLASCDFRDSSRGKLLKQYTLATT